MSLHTFLFAFITLINLVFYISTYNQIFHSKSISTFFHLYFCIFATFVYRDYDLIYCSLVYFIADSILNIYFNCFRAFNKIHHIFVLYLIYNHEYLNKTLINYSGIHEFSTILLCLIDLKIISKNTFENIFPFSFIICRIVIFNILTFLYIHEISYQIDMFNWIIISLLNIMNIAIIIKMRLLQKSYNMLYNLLYILIYTSNTQ
jgi:hypothetical protein